MLEADGGVWRDLAVISKGVKKASWTRSPGTILQFNNFERFGSALPRPLAVAGLHRLPCMGTSCEKPGDAPGIAHVPKRAAT